MIERRYLLNRLIDIKSAIVDTKPLIHCLTNHITINDCANVILSVYGKPIMAEYSEEVADITASANALAINLGNISENRMKSIMISGQVANENNIPIIIDIVGVSCSKLRLNFALNFIEKFNPSVIKGNMSEIKAIFGMDIKSKGIDVNDQDMTTKDTLSNNIEIVAKLALKTKSVIVATGVLDIVSNGSESYIIENGCEQLSRITGTGCMLNCLIATYISSHDIINSAILGTVTMGIAGELSKDAKGTATFKIELLDNISTINSKDIIEKIKIRVVE